MVDTTLVEFGALLAISVAAHMSVAYYWAAHHAANKIRTELTQPGGILPEFKRQLLEELNPQSEEETKVEAQKQMESLKESVTQAVTGALQAFQMRAQKQLGEGITEGVLAAVPAGQEGLFALLQMFGGRKAGKALAVFQQLQGMQKR